MRRIVRWLRSLFRSRRALDADMREEFAFHLQARTEALSRQGLPREAAHRRARMEFGSIAGYQDQGFEARGVRVFDDLCRDVQFGARMLRRQPSTTLVIILTLALGIGANTAIFSIIDAVFLRTLPVSEPDRLVLFSGDTLQGIHSSSTPPEGIWTQFSSETYDFLRAARLPFEGVAAFASGNDTVSAQVLGRSDRGMPDTGSRSDAHLVSGNYFKVMGVTAALGRTLTPDDDRPAAAPVTVVSDSFWRHVLHADAQAVGGIVKLNQVAFTVVGVMPAPFFGERIRSAPDFWVPLARQPDIQLRESLLLRPDHYWLSLIGRLAPGQSRQAAESAVTAGLRQFLTNKAGSSIDAATRDRIRRVGVTMVSGARGISLVREQEGQPLTLLLVAVGCVLLIACANVATLLLSRATARGSEVAVRRALGAGRARLLRQWLTESVLFAALGAAGGLLLAHWAAPAVQSFLPSSPLQTTLSTPVLAFTMAITLLASLIFGLAPALQVGRVDALATLRSMGHGPQVRRRAFGATEPFVVAQIAVSLVLVIGATLFARTLFNLEREPLGFDQDRVLLVRVNPKLAGYTPAGVGALYRRLYEQVAALPGVDSATFARYSPFGGSLSSFSARVEGYAPAPGEEVRLEAVEVGPNYPQTFGMPVIAGRAIGLEDGVGTRPVAMVNEAFARRFFATSSPIGHHFWLDQPEYEVVGVVTDSLFHSAHDQTIPFVFLPMLQETSQRALDCEIELRVHGDADALAPAVRQAVTNTDSRVAVTRTRTLRAQVLATFGPERLAAAFIGAFAGLALLLAAVGLYGVVSHGVARRTQEIGVRLALGAAKGDIVWLIVRDTLICLGIGMAIGAITSALAGRLIANQLFGVSAGDVISFLLASTILAAVALGASFVPAARALRIRPTTALRTE